MFSKVLIANRGEIALRILRTLRKLDVRGATIHSEAEPLAPWVREADESYCVGPGPARDSYISIPAVLKAIQDSGAQAVHPGYGFLSENPDFAEACTSAGIAFLGPAPEQIRLFGLKHTARDLASRSGAPLLPGTDLVTSADEAVERARTIGFPVMLKSTAGGGGIGMQVCEGEAELRDAFDRVRRLGQSNFGNAGAFVEKFVARARHVEVQIFGDGTGRVLALGVRDCSLQRRNQKVVEETPAPNLPEGVARQLMADAVGLAASVNYRSAGTVEFLYDTTARQHYFLEVNTRLQVEHCVTEEVMGVDLVEWMVRLGAGDPGFWPDKPLVPAGHSMQARIYGEDPGRNFQPSPGELTEVAFPANCRVDAWVESGTVVSPFYDPMLAKIIVHGSDREAAVERLRRALAETRLAGIVTNLEYLREVTAEPFFTEGKVITRSLADFHYHPPTVRVIAPGTFTTIQDYPGRIGYWEVGVPPSGPMDDYAFRLANRIAGNDEGAPALECTVTGPSLHFDAGTTICVAGADMRPEVDGAPVPLWQPVPVRAGQELELISITGEGCRTYIAFRGGLDVPLYLGSCATFTLGQFGGHGGRVLHAGDLLYLRKEGPRLPPAGVPDPSSVRIPVYTNRWEIKVIYGPHGAPDFFTPGDIDTFFSTDWVIHYNSSRTGVRLIGPKPVWARPDGGEAGLHPSNIHDNAYAIGTVDFTGDMPIILGPDGPSLGGFVCPVTIRSDELWKVGQLRPGDKVRFVLTDAQGDRQDGVPDSAILRAPELPPDLPRVVYRPCGDSNLLVEYGPLELDLGLRLRAHALMTWLRERQIPGIIDLTPGVRSLQVHFDRRRWSLESMADLLAEAEKQLPDMEHLEVPSRIVRLPLSWDDPATRLAIEKYMQSVRKDAPWCPSNIEFIRRINGLESIDDVREIVFNASYLVLGLGDVYLGAPVATPVDPRHRLVTTKYNPARTWTPENAVGIGGAYLCVYGMEGPGGYQFVGRTIQMWNRYRVTPVFSEPWLLRHFDQIKFYPVTADKLLRAREQFPYGRYPLQITETTFRLSEYRKFLATIAGDAVRFKTRQQAAFTAERERWAGLPVAYEAEAQTAPSPGSEGELLEGATAVDSPVTANVWKCEVQAGDRVAKGQTLIILEAMKMEIGVAAPCDGAVAAVTCKPGQMVMPGQRLAVIAREIEN
ncbi:MAG: 5-oxoprolinase/urea amidolyase family protein [Verrucomicrobia bacterium]|nr:5-oxoprolinase/urea amidolyase family protein [Verrucomicrobiota bacterium]